MTRRGSADHGPVSELGTILGIWAHPDDEVYLSGGVMAHARDLGQRVVCVTATRGELGQAGPDPLSPVELGRMREQELRTALAQLGVEEHHFLDVVDGRCAQEPQDQMVERLRAILDEVAPDTILTFGPDGMTGHEDHQTVCRWVTAAHAATSSDAYLLYATSTAEQADAWAELEDTLDVYLVPGLPLRRVPEELAFELRLDLEAAERKLAALRALASQTAELIDLLGPERYRDWCAVESFVDAGTVTARGWPTWRPPAEG